MANVLISGTKPEAITAGQLTGERRHKLIGDLPEDYKFETELEPYMRSADAYVFMPDADPLLAMSVLVAKRIEPDTYWNKPVVFVEEDGKRHPIAALFEDLSARGLAKEKPAEVFTIAKGIDQVRDVIGKVTEAPKAAADNSANTGDLATIQSDEKRPDTMIAVYCSASTKKPADLALAAEAGNSIAQRGWGITYGGANVSMMGAVASAARNLDGYVLGVATAKVWKHNRELDPDNTDIPMSELKLTDDIYLRMKEMFMPEAGKPVKGVMVLPGGAGSAQETLAMLQLRKAEPVFKDVPLVLINADGVWDGLAKAAKAYGLEEGKDFHVYPDVKSAMPFLDKAVAALDARPDWPVSDIDQAAKKLGGWRSDRRPAAGPASDIGAPAAKPGDQPAP